MQLADYVMILSLNPIPSFIFQDRQIRFANKKFSEATGYSEQELENIAVKEFIHPDDRSYVRKNILNCYTGKEINQSIEFRAFIKMKETVYVLGYFTRIELNGAPAILVQCININMHKQAEEALARELEVSAALADLSGRLLLTDSFEEISQLVLEEAKRLTGSRFGFVGYLDEITGHIILPTLSREIWDTCQVKNKTFIFEKFTGLWGWVLDNKKAILTNSPADDPRYKGIPPGHLPIKRFLAVPAMIGEKLVGEVALANSDCDYNDTDLTIAEKLSNIYAIAIQRKRMDEDLKRSEREYRTLFETMTQGVLYRSAGGVLTSANPAAERILGVSLEQIRGSTDLNEILQSILEDGSDLPGTEYPSMVALRTGKEVYNVVMGIYNPKECRRRWLKVNAVPQFKAGENKPYQVYTTFDDITELKMAEEKIRTSHQQLLDIIESLPPATFVIDSDKKVIAWNQGMEELTGVNKEEIIGKGDYAYAVPFYGENRPMLIDLVFSEDRDTEQKYDIIKRDGSTLFAETYVPSVYGGKGAYLWAKLSRLYDKDGNIIGAIQSIHDITDRKRVEKEFQEQSVFLQRLIDNIPYPVYFKDVKGLYQVCNKAFEVLTGSGKEGIIGKSIYDFFPKDLADKYNEMDSALLSKPDIQVYETSLLYADGTRHEVIFNKAPYLNSDGTLVGLVGVIIDITPRKKAEEALAAERHRFATLTERAPFGMALFDEQGSYKYINPKFKEIFGYGLDDIQVREAWFNKAYPDPDYRHRVLTFWDKDEKNYVPGEKKTRLSKVTCKDGKEKIISFTPVRLHTGEFLIACEDITRRRLADRKLKAANQQLMDIIDFLPDATFVIDNGGQVIAWNKAIEEMTGVKKEEILGRGDYAYAVPFYGEPRPILIDLVLMPQKEVEDKYEHVVRSGFTLYTETYVPFTYKGKGAILWGKATLLLDSDGNVVGAIESIRDVTDKKKAEEQLKYLGLHDTLTGLYNRTFFEEGMRRASDGRFDPIGIIMCDLDGLKLINDTLGHDAGDSLLVAAAGVIGLTFRRGDIVSRIGGDEFAILLTSSDEKAMEEACVRLRSSFEEYNSADPEIPLNVSIGFAVGSKETTSVHDLFKEADNNMYREKLHRSQSARSAIVQTLMKALEARDFITEGHAQRLQGYVRELAGTLGMSMRSISDLSLLAKFHDIGKVGISDKILFKPGVLTIEEALEMQRHCEIGHRIAKSAPDLEPIADWILKHHEWWNGGGYPLGLKGDEIPLECRILAIVDAYDAMTSDRPYRKALPREHAVNELKRCGGSQFDPYLVNKFIDILDKE